MTGPIPADPNTPGAPATAAVPPIDGQFNAPQTQAAYPPASLYPGQPYPPQMQYPAPPYAPQTQGYPPHTQPYPPQVQPFPAQAHYPGQPNAPYAQPYPPQVPYPAQPYQPMAAVAPQIFINNTAASAAAAGINAYGLRKRNSFMTHVVLFVLTAGVGNVLYAWYVYSWNRKRGL